MKASHLRIGNLVQNKSGEIITICGDDLAEIDGYDDSLNIEGIPLTEEWLLKFGFEKSDKYWHNGLGSNVWYDLENNYVRQAYGGDIRTMFTISAMNIEHVHQLQNLYFALTGEELEVK